VPACQRFTTPDAAWLRRPAFIGLFAIGLAGALGTGCAERDKASPVGLGTVEPGRIDALVGTTYATPPVLDTFAETVINTGESATLYAGYFGPRRMRSLVHFSGLPSGTVQEASLHLRVTGDAGDAVSASIRVHRVLSDWSESTDDADTTLQFDANPAVIVASAPGETALVAAIPTTIVQTWVDNEANNDGLLLAPDNTVAVLRKFASSEADSNRPFLRVVSQLAGSEARTDTLFADRDTYLTAPDTTASNRTAPLLLAGRQNGLTHRTALEFELPADVDARSTVNFANLEVSLDPKAFGLFDSTISLAAHEIVSAVDTSAVVFRTAAEGSADLTQSSDSLAISLTSLVGRQRLAGERRIKVLLRATGETLDTDFVAIVSSEGAGASAPGPRLRLIVSTSEPADTLLLAPSAAAATERAP
jgi:hypothetical protein